MRRTITHIEWATGKFAGRTFIRLDCSHERSIGGHVFLSRVVQFSWRGDWKGSLARQT